MKLVIGSIGLIIVVGCVDLESLYVKSIGLIMVGRVDLESLYVKISKWIYRFNNYFKNEILKLIRYVFYLLIFKYHFFYFYYIKGCLVLFNMIKFLLYYILRWI